MRRRGSGILLHITSLPSPYGVGDMGPGAYQFADFLAEAKQSFWQILPLNPTDPAFGNSPYHSISAFASSPLLISPELMVRDGLLAKSDVVTVPNHPEGLVDYPAAIAFKEKLFFKAFKRFKNERQLHEYERFCSENSSWLDNYALFVALKTLFQGRVWVEWPHGVRERQLEALEGLRNQLHERVEMQKFLQYLFFQQWNSLKGYCNQRGIQIFGDMPIYVEFDGVDVWTNPVLFMLDNDKRPLAVAGVPPDYFSETGQLWGNPIYRWDVLKDTGYAWWIQ